MTSTNTTDKQTQSEHASIDEAVMRYEEALRDREQANAFADRKGFEWPYPPTAGQLFENTLVALLASVAHSLVDIAASKRPPEYQKVYYGLPQEPFCTCGSGGERGAPGHGPYCPFRAKLNQSVADAPEGADKGMTLAALEEVKLHARTLSVEEVRDELEADDEEKCSCLTPGVPGWRKAGPHHRQSCPKWAPF